MSYVLWSHHIRSNTVEELESLPQTQDSWIELIKTRTRASLVGEFFLLKTCNRVDVLAYFPENLEMIPGLTRNVDSRVFSDIKEIIIHFLEVGSSLDSVVFGENQILGQIRTAYKEQLQKGNIGPRLSRLLQLILQECKNIRTDSALSQIQDSIASVAAKIIDKKNFNKKILLVGFGETHQILYKILLKKNFNNVCVTNRSFSKISELQTPILNYEDYLSFSGGPFDIISFATSSHEPLLNEKHLQSYKPELILDLSIPANASRKLVEQHSINYCGMDEIKKYQEKNQENSETIKAQIKKLIFQSAKNIYYEFSLNALNFFINDHIENTKKLQIEAKNDINELNLNLSEEEKNRIINWSERLIKKINHFHLNNYKEAFKAGLKSNESEDRNS